MSTRHKVNPERNLFYKNQHLQYLIPDPTDPKKFTIAHKDVPQLCGALTEMDTEWQVRFISAPTNVQSFPTRIAARTALLEKCSVEGPLK
jgi:hypothetical protein